MLDAGRPVLDVARHRRGRRQLRRLHRLRPRLPRAPASGNWGVVDTVDCINAARYLVGARRRRPGAPRHPRRERRRLHDAQRAHAPSTSSPPAPALFGLADLEAFATGGTHKFESQYLRRAASGRIPETADVYRERSPIHHVDDISCPVIVLQGLEDAIVPPAQAEHHRGGAAAQGPAATPTSAFEGEQHGFRKAENIVRRLEAELYFYGQRVRVRRRPTTSTPVEIENLTTGRPSARGAVLASTGRRAYPPDGGPLRGRRVSGGGCAPRVVYSDAMRIRTISLIALAVAVLIAAIAIIAAPAFAATSAPKPPVVKKYIAYGAGRKAQMADYSPAPLRPAHLRAHQPQGDRPPSHGRGRVAERLEHLRRQHRATTTRSPASRRSSSSTRTAPSIS